jgi:hypothetical protein
MNYCSGGYWTWYKWGEGYYWGYDLAEEAYIDAHPEVQWGTYDPAGPCPFGPYEIYPANTDSSFNWKIDTEKVFFGWYQAWMVLDVPPDDQILFQLSQDGSDFETFTEPGFWSAQLHAEVTDDLMGDETTLRLRWITGDLMYSNWIGVQFDNLKFLGMKDLNAPVTTIAMQGTFDETYHYYTSEVGVTLSATDDVTGVAATYYILDGVEHEYTRPFVIEEDGEHSLCFYSVDYEGNVEEQKCVENFYIDQTGPSVSITGPEPGIYLFGNKILNSDKYIFLFGGVTVSASVSVDDAPLATVEFYMNDVLFAEDTSSPYQMTCTMKNTGSATFKVIAKDVLGESDQDSLTVDTYLKIF